MTEVVAPLVTIAIPTFNRVELLKRAIASAQAQDYPSVEILIVDNASEDVTQGICQALAAEDSRIRYMRQPRNVGSTRNFETGLENARGHYFMWLADDDWITSNYVRRCLEELEDGGHAIVVGRDYWYFQDNAVAEPIVSALEPEPAKRMLNYLRTLSSNAATYGLSRTADLREQLPIPRRLAGDWVWVMAMLSKGTLGVVPDAQLFRDPGGLSLNLHDLAVQSGYGKLVSWFPRMLGIVNVFTSIARGRGFRSPRSDSARLILAVKASLVVALKLNPLDDLISLGQLTVRRFMPNRVYDILRILYRPIRRIEHRIKSRVLSTPGRPFKRH